MKNKNMKEERLKPISLYPLKPEKALSLVMQIDLRKISTTSKPCKICHTVKPFTEFCKNSQIKSGISNRCKACDKIKNSKRIKGKGWGWKDIKSLSPTLEQEFDDLFGSCNVWAKGKLVMRKGEILDEEWYQKKLCQLGKGRRKEKGENNANEE